MNLDVDLKFNEGEIYCLFGESGAGKSSILRMIADLMKPDSGLIQIGEKCFYDSVRGISVKTQKRNVGFLFQDFALFPNMNVEENIKYGIKKGDDISRLNEVIEVFGLRGMEKREINTLSGGQKQRVALARSIVQSPEILLLDEPLSSLDGKIRFDIQNLLLNLKKQFGLSIILVTHDISEVVKLADNVGIIKNGKILKSGKPTEVFEQASFSAKFQFSGKIVNIEKQDFLSILFIMVGNNLIKVVDDSGDAQFEIGDEVLIGSKAFNPIIQKIT